MTEGNFNPSVVETPAEVAESVRMPSAKCAEEMLEILEETESVLIQLPSSWWGKEALGLWGEWFFIKPDETSEGGALFIDEGIKMNDPLRKLSSYESIMNSRGGLTSKAAHREKKKAFNWSDSRAKLGPGMPPSDERDYISDGSLPISVIDTAITAPANKNHLVFREGEVSRGALEEGDIRIDEMNRHPRFGWKFILKGDSYKVLSSKGENISDDVSFEKHHLTFNGNDWVMDAEGTAIFALATALNEKGYTLSVSEEFEGEVESVLEQDNFNLFAGTGFPG